MSSEIENTIPACSLEMVFLFHKFHNERLQHRLSWTTGDVLKGGSTNLRKETSHDTVALN